MANRYIPLISGYRDIIIYCNCRDPTKKKKFSSWSTNTTKLWKHNSFEIVNRFQSWIFSGLTVQYFSMKIAASSWKLKRADNVKNKGWVKKGMSESVTFQNNRISLNILRLCHINWIWEFDAAANCLTFQSTAALAEKIKNHILFYFVSHKWL